MNGSPDRPDWWRWELELSGHLLRRMADRSFNETDLRAMMSDASDIGRDLEPGRWVIATGHNGRPWEVIVEPDPSHRRLVVITAYMVE